MTNKVEEKPSGLALLREPFPSHQISKLPKPTKQQTESVKADYKIGIRCEVCGQWHHPKVVHLDYVGHAALTDRLLDADAQWTWEPMALDAVGLPALDQEGGLWIRLTVCGVTRIGYGDAQGKTGGDAMKERIGDALRNAAMRFGAALDLWHKGDLHGDEGDEDEAKKKAEAEAKRVADEAVKKSNKKHGSAWTSDHEGLLIAYREAALGGLESLKKFHEKLPASQVKNDVWAEHGESLKEASHQVEGVTV